jgi:putative flippase GtrA
VSTVAASSRRELALAFLRDIRSPEWGVAGQGARFAMSGCLVAAVYLGVTAVLHDVFALPFQLALIIGFCTGVAVHFTLQRLFVWRHYHGFALGVTHQAARYLAMCGSQYAITALATSQLPSLLHVPVELVFGVTSLTVAGVNFIVFRGRVFHSSTEPS